MRGGSAAHWEGVVLIRNRSASSYRSRMTSGISVFMERKPLRVATATRDLGGGGDGEPSCGHPRFCAGGTAWPLCSLFPGWSNRSSPHCTICQWGRLTQGSRVGTLEMNNSITAQLRCVPNTCAAADNMSLITGRSVPKEASGRLR